MILRSLLCIAKNWICYWSLMVIYNCECSLSCILYKANVWTFDSCHNSVYGLSEKKRSFETLRLMLCIFFISHNLWENDWKQISIKMWKHQVFTILCDAMTSMNGDCSSALFCTFDTVTDYDTKTILFFVVFQRTLDHRHCSLMDCQRM